MGRGCVARDVGVEAQVESNRSAIVGAIPAEVGHVLSDRRLPCDSGGIDVGKESTLCTGQGALNGAVGNWEVKRISRPREQRTVRSIHGDR